MTEYRTIVTLRVRINGQDCRAHLYGPETKDQDLAIAFGTALVESGAAIGWRVVTRRRPDYGQILDDLNGSWYFSPHVHYISEDAKALPVFKGDVAALNAGKPAPVLLCDLCGLSVLTDDRDVVSGLPRHPECIPL